jgi:hypothetical protein
MEEDEEAKKRKMSEGMVNRITEHENTDRKEKENKIENRPKIKMKRRSKRL